MFLLPLRMAKEPTEAAVKNLDDKKTAAEETVTTASLVRPSERDSVTLTNSVDRPPEAPYVYAGLNDDAFHTTFVGFVEQARQQTADLGLTLYCRILPGFQDAQRRFEEHSDDPNYRLDGCAGIEAYIVKQGFKPATLRKWRQREKERMFLQALKLLPGMRKKCKYCGQEHGHTAACPKNAARPLPHPKTETEEKVLAEQCVLMAQTLVGPSVQPLADRVKKVIHMAEAVREAAQGGSYEHVRFEEPSAPSSGQEPVPEPPQPPPISGDPVPEPEPGTLEELRQRIARIADTREINKALEEFLSRLVAPLLERHAYAPSHHDSVSVRRHKDNPRERISLDDWLEYRGEDPRITEQIGTEKSLGRVVGEDALGRPRVRWYSGSKKWIKPYSLFDESSVRVLFDFQAAENYAEAFRSYPPEQSTASEGEPEQPAPSAAGSEPVANDPASDPAYEEYLKAPLT
jgi:hypothetical protein